MKRAARILTVILISACLAVFMPLSSAASQRGDNLIYEARQLLHCRNGEFPRYFRLQDFTELLAEFDPDLAEELYRHIESVAWPAEIGYTPPPELAPRGFWARLFQWE